MHVTFVDNQQYFDNAYLQGEDTSRLEDKWDWDVEKELKEEQISLLLKRMI